MFRVASCVAAQRGQQAKWHTCMSRHCRYCGYLRKCVCHGAAAVQPGAGGLGATTGVLLVSCGCVLARSYVG